MKRCRTCLDTKDLRDFYFQSEKHVTTDCRACISIKNKRKYQERKLARLIAKKMMEKSVP